MIQREEIRRLEFCGITYQLSDEVKIFKNLSFIFPQHNVVWVHSEAGAGKSSLFQIMDGLVRPTSGSYKINGQDVMEMTFDEFNKYRLNIGYSFDFGGMINNRTLYQNLSLPLEYHNMLTAEERDQRVKKVLKFFGIEQMSDKRPSSVPGTIRKAMCVARAFIHSPQVVLLDDPTTGLRAEVRDQLGVMVKEHIKENPKAVVFIATEDEEFMNEFDYKKIVVRKDLLEAA